MGKESIAEYNSPFATRLRECIKEKCKKSDKKESEIIGELARHIGATRQAVSQYRNGTVSPNIEKLISIASYFDISTDYLLKVSKTKSTNPKIQEVCEFTGLCEEAVGFSVTAKGAPNAPRGELIGSPPERKITLAGHAYDGFLDIINSLMVYQLKDVENLLGSMKRYVDAMQTSKKNRKEIVENCGKGYDIRFGAQPHEPSKDDYLASRLELFENAITHGESSINVRFADEHSRAIKDIRAARLDASEAINALLAHFTEKTLERLRDNDLTDTTKETADDGEH